MTAVPLPDDPSNLAHALAYAGRGWRVVPVPSGRKVPSVTAWQREGTTDTARIEHWWTQAPDHGIGIVTGRASRIFVLDVDVAGDKRGDETLAELVDAYGPLPDTFTVVTGSLGSHIYFEWPDDTPIRNSAGNRLGPGLDVRGEGGFVVAPPSLHASGRRYEHEASSPLEVAPAPGWLLAMLTERDDRPERPAIAGVRTDRPGDQWAATVTWDELLGRDGWTKLRPGPEGEDRWVRPGKDAREGPSATVGYGGTDLLKNFTSSHPHLRAEETYTKLGYLAATRFDGDHSAAARWCREQGYGNQLDDDLEVTGTAAPRPAGVELPPPTEPPPPWGDLTPWPELPELPPFPLASLPGFVAEHATAAAEARQVPVDLCAMLAIGALAAAATGRAQVWLHEDWKEPMALYLVVAMRSGAGKSPAEKAMAGWIRRWERQRLEMVEAANEAAEVAKSIAQRNLDKLARNEGASVDDVLDARAALRTADAQLIASPRLIIDDSTPESVATLLKAHGERLAVLSTEADLFDSLLRGNERQRASLNVYLKAWSGDRLTRDRKGGTDSGPESTVLENPLLTVSVTVQPSVLARLLSDPEMVGRGFPARFMVSCPADLMGRRDQRLRFRSRATATAGAYETTCTALADRWATWQHPADLRLTGDAADLFEDFLVELEPDLAIGADLENLAEWVAKLTASVARYAGLLHLCEGDPSAPITADTMARAIDLGRYWLAHASGLAGSHEDDATRQARLLLDAIAELGTAQVTLSDIQKACRRPGEGLNRVGDYVEPVQVLIDHGWMRWRGEGDWRANVGVPRSASPKFEVRPDLVGSTPDAVTRVTRVTRVDSAENDAEPAVEASYSRNSRIASMGERDSPSIYPQPLHPLDENTTRVTRVTDQPIPAVDNPGNASAAAVKLPALGLDEILGLTDEAQP